MDGAWWERSAHYLCSNTNKRDLTLDLGTDDGLAMLRRLIARERRGARELLAAGARELRARLGADPGRSTRAASSCACPRSGCRGRGATTSGFAQTMEQVTGLAWITGHVDDQPRIQQGPSDPNAGMHAAFALIVGLAEREATGRGSLLEVTMVEGALNAAAELVLETTAYGNLLERDGNRSPNVAPQGLYRGRDDETWLAISVATDAQWDGVGRRARPSRRGRPIPSSRRTPAGAPATTSSTRGLEEWAATQRRRRSGGAARRARRAGRARTRSALDDRPSAAPGPRLLRGRSTTRSSARSRTPTWPFRFASVDRWLRTPAPTLGQHNHEILVDDLGVDEATYQRLVDTSIIGDRPLGL